QRKDADHRHARGSPFTCRPWPRPCEPRRERSCCDGRGGGCAGDAPRSRYDGGGGRGRSAAPAQASAARTAHVTAASRGVSMAAELDRPMELMRDARTIAVVGVSSLTWKPSHDVTRYLIGAGYTVYLVNPDETEIF